ncbi:hypothetical protein [Variovorax sp. J31P207]|uniref:hypothetical protein n=1 Tax=Variovorax sp. J31P207 TaxID=3053510 RepID=UPI002576D885|nr:hypothetical protein [Variovorax sp. J31P207]MDM0069743.1 hypothetical protein [Variovorax sp. J31P207]
MRKATGTQRRHLSDDALLVHIKAIHAETRGGYGWPRCTAFAPEESLIPVPRSILS